MFRRATRHEARPVPLSRDRCPNRRGDPAGRTWPRWTLPILATCVAGCGGSGSGRESQPPVPAVTRTVLDIGPYRALEIHTEPGVESRTISAKTEHVWAVLPAVYERLGIPPTVSDPPTLTMGNQRHRASRFEGSRMSTVIECGSSLGGPLANQYEITLSVLTTLTPQGDDTVLTTTVDAFGEPRAVTGNRIHCTSKGLVELRVAQIVAETLEGGS